DGRELALGIELLEQVPDRVAPLFVGVGLEEGTVRREVVDVAVAGVANRAEAEDGLVAAVAGTKDIFAWRLGSVAEEDAALHALGLGHACQSQERRREVDSLDQ